MTSLLSVRSTNTHRQCLGGDKLERGEKPAADRVVVFGIEGKLQLGAAEQEVIGRHGVLDPDGVLELGAGHSGCDLGSGSRIAGNPREDRFDPVAIGESEAPACRLTNVYGALLGAGG